MILYKERIRSSGTQQWISRPIRYMTNAINPDSGIRIQDYYSVYVPIYRNPLAFDATVDFLRDKIIAGDFRWVS